MVTEARNQAADPPGAKDPSNDKSKTTPQIVLTNEGPEKIVLGRTAKITVTVRNSGTVAAEKVVVRAKIPEGIKFRDRTEGTTLKWELGDLASGESRTFTYSIWGTQAGTFVLAAEVTGQDKDLARQTLSVRVEGLPAMHMSAYDTEDPVEIGGHTTYVVEVRSEGTGACTKVGMVSTIPEEMEFVTASGPTSYKTEKNRIIFEPVATLAPGDKLVYKIECKAVNPGTGKHSATLTFEQSDKPIVGEESTSIYR